MRPHFNPKSPIRPASHFIGTGDLLRSQHGRLLSPVPTIRLKSDRSSLNSIRRLDEWLAREANTEAAQHPDKYLPQYLTPPLSDSDVAAANLILFGDDRGPADEHRVNPAVVNGNLVHIETGS